MSEQTQRRELRFRAGERGRDVGALLLRPADADALLLLAHGAGADMRHRFQEELCTRLAARRIATFRYQFPYAEQGRRSPDRQPVLLSTVRAALAEATHQAGDLPLLAGGKSMGGRMTSLAAAETGLPGVQGIVFVGFPLHAAGRPSSDRAEHLFRIELPLLFLQGTRDPLAELSRIRALCSRLGPRARLHVVEGGDHSFRVPKRSGRSHQQVLDELADAVRSFADTLLA